MERGTLKYDGGILFHEKINSSVENFAGELSFLIMLIIILLNINNNCIIVIFMFAFMAKNNANFIWDSINALVCDVWIRVQKYTFCVDLLHYKLRPTAKKVCLLLPYCPLKLWCLRVPLLYPWLSWPTEISRPNKNRPMYLPVSCQVEE